jgi:DnaJ family protein C protein 27
MQDLSGHSEFFEIRNEFYKDAQGGILVFDVTSRESFDELDSVIHNHFCIHARCLPCHAFVQWLAEAAKFGALPREMPIAVCANKTDKKRLISEDEGRQFAQARGLQYFETSACSGTNVNDMFMFLFQCVVRRVRNTTTV